MFLSLYALDFVTDVIMIVMTAVILAPSTRGWPW